MFARPTIGAGSTANQLVHVVDESHATGTSYAIVFREPSPQEGVISARVTPRSLVEYQDTYRRTAEGWKIARRFYQFNFLQAEEDRRPAAVLD